MDSRFINEAIAKIYDCAIEPSGWEETLEFIRGRLGLAFLAIHFVAFSQGGSRIEPQILTLRTEWDEGRMRELLGMLDTIPGFDQMRGSAIDSPVTQLRLVDEQEFRRSVFCQSWVEPQGLRDACNTPVIQRDSMTAMLSAWTSDDREPITEAEIEALSLLTPHMRRTLLISDMLNEAHVLLQIHRGVLDSFSAAVFLVGEGGVVLHQNAAAEKLLSEASLLQNGAGGLRPWSEAHRNGFLAAVRKACSENEADLGTWGSGMALPRSDGDIGLVNILPFGTSDRRHALGPGMAAIFVSGDGSVRPPSTEMLSALTGLTSAEASIALAIAEGKSVEAIARSTSVSVNTVRKHLSNSFHKTGTASQHELGALVNRLRLPFDPSLRRQ